MANDKATELLFHLGLCHHLDHRPRLLAIGWREAISLCSHRHPGDDTRLHVFAVWIWAATLWNWPVCSP
jgi:hypothetical protein